METTTASSQTSKNLVAYVVLACAISWAIEIPLALTKQGIIQPIFPEWFHYFLSYGPMLSALMVTWATEGQPGIKKIWARITRWQVGGIWWLAALSPLIIGLVMVLAMNFFTDSNISLTELGVVPFLPPLGIGALFLWILTSGIGEEIGWRGYALPRLQKDHNALYSTLILTFLWALWHLPLFFYLFDPGIAVGWIFALYTGAIVFTWLLNSTEGSILIAAVFHGCFNYMTSSSAGNGLLATVVSIMLMVWAIVVIFVYRPKTLSTKGKFVV